MSFIKLTPTKETRTAVCPAACVSVIGAERIGKASELSNKLIHEVLSLVQGNLFAPLTLVTKNGSKTVSLFNIYHGDLAKEDIGEDDKYTVRFKSKEYKLNKCLGLYPTRELFNPKSPLAGNRDEIVDGSCDATFWNETVCAKIDGMVKGYVGRVSGDSEGNSDSKWGDAVYGVSNKSNGDFVTRSKTARVISRLGPQVMNAMNGEMPDTEPAFGKNGKKALKTKIDSEAFEITKEQFDSLENTKTIYIAAIEEFKKMVVENFPNPKKNIPITVPKITVHRDGRMKGQFFDWEVVIYGLPGGPVNMYIRAHSDKKSTYYPKNLFAQTKETPKGTLIIADNTDINAMVCDDPSRACKVQLTLNIPYEVEVNVPSIVTAENGKPDLNAVNLDEVIGMDAGIAVGGLITTIKPDQIGPDMVDWHEAVYAYSKDGGRETNLFKTTATKSTRDDLVRLCDEYAEGRYTLVGMFTLGLRDGAPTDEAHDWIPSCDPCAKLFAWMQHRLDANGHQFYNKEQLSIIGHTKVWRKFIRQQIANRRHYFAEQAKWDVCHDTITEVFADMSPVASELRTEYESLTDKIRVESTFILSTSLLNTKCFGMASVISMENLNLNNVEKGSKFMSLYSTVKREWHMGPMQGCKLSAGKNSNVAVITFDHPVAKQDVLANCKQTKQWNVPDDVKVEGNVATITCTPTKEGARCRDSEWADHYVKNAMHIALLKKDVERIVTRRGTLFKAVPAKMTSQTCHACGHNKCSKKDENLTMEQCLTKKLNYRQGRVFVCGNPECTLHGRIQNADSNAAFCIRNRVKFKDSDFSKSLKDK